jgi:hypothetical protein
MEKKMLKKIAGWTLLAVLSGGLIWGAVNRTMAKSEQTHTETQETEGYQRGQNRDQELASNSDTKGNAGSRSSETTEASQGRRRGSEAEADQDNEFSSSSQASHSEDEFITLAGMVWNMEEDSVIIQIDDGEPLIIEGRPWSYMQETGFLLGIGDSVLVTGFEEDGEFKVATVENLSTNELVVLRDDSGRPAWSGRGRWNS